MVLPLSSRRNGQRKSVASSRKRRDVAPGKENERPSAKGDGVKRKRNEDVANLDPEKKILRKRMIAMISEQVEKEREKNGKADIKSKLNTWNSSVSEPGLMLTKDSITGHINNNKRRKKKDAAKSTASADAHMPAASGVLAVPQASSSQGANANPGQADSPPADSSTRPSATRPTDKDASTRPATSNSTSADAAKDEAVASSPANSSESPTSTRSDCMPDNLRPCAAGDRCTLNTGKEAYPGHADSQHKCPGCKEHIHALCGVDTDVNDVVKDMKDAAGKIDIAWRRTCHNCSTGASSLAASDQPNSPFQEAEDLPPTAPSKSNTSQGAAATTSPTSDQPTPTTFLLNAIFRVLQHYPYANQLWTMEQLVAVLNDVFMTDSKFPFDLSTIKALVEGDRFNIPWKEGYYRINKERTPSAIIVRTTTDSSRVLVIGWFENESPEEFISRDVVIPINACTSCSVTIEEIRQVRAWLVEAKASPSASNNSAAANDPSTIIMPNYSTSNDPNKDHAAPFNSSTGTTANNPNKAGPPDSPTAKKKKKKVGRPKGTTDDAKHAKKEALIAARDWVVEQYKAAQDDLAKQRSEKGSTEGLKQLPKGFLKDLINHAREGWGLHDLDPEFNVPKQTISNRINHGKSLKVRHPGTASPMASIEPDIVRFAVLANRMNRTMTKPELIEMANDLIAGTEHEKRIREFKAKRAHVESADDIGQLLGEAWYKGFMKRNGRYLKAKRKKNFAINRSNSTKYEDYELMYNTMNRVVLKSRNGRRYDTPVYMDVNGEVTEDEMKALGHAVEVEVTDPDNIMYADEVGSNTNMKDDGNIGGQLYIAPKDENATVLAAINDSHFTVLGFTSGSGKPVMIVIIFKAKEVGKNWKHGFDMFAKEVGYGEGKTWPGGPTVQFKGVEVPCYCRCSDSGSINSEILADIFKRMDDLKLTTRGPNGKAPMAMLDGHGSRLGAAFLDYISNKDTKWYVILGVPNQTHIWQLGDSDEQNGCFKMLLTKWKINLVMRKKQVGGLPLSVMKDEVALGVRIACEGSFFRVAQNIRAMARRGLGITMNRGCLDLPQVLRTASAEYQAERNEVLARRGQPTTSLVSTASSQPSNTVAGLDTLNLTNGLAGNIMGMIIDEYNRQGGEEAHKKRKEEADLARKNIAEAKYFSSGALYAANDGGPELGTPTQNERRRRDNEQKKKESDKQKKALARMRKLKAGVEKIRRTSKYKKLSRLTAWRNNQVEVLKEHLMDRTKGFTNADLKTLCQWKKVKGDGKMPTGKLDLVNLFIKTRIREEPIVPTIEEINEETSSSDNLQDINTISNDMEQEEESADTADASEDEDSATEESDDESHNSGIDGEGSEETDEDEDEDEEDEDDGDDESSNDYVPSNESRAERAARRERGNANT